MPSKDLKIIIKAAHAGGEVLKKYFGQTLTQKEKSNPSDLQTKADLESEKAILKILRIKFPKYNINSEEDGESKNGSDYTFVVDPLDGTANFVIGIPNFCVSIGLLHKNKIIAGVIYQPIPDVTYFAERGKGAFLNNKRMRVSKVLNKRRIIIAPCFNYTTNRDYKIAMFATLIKARPKRTSWNWSVAGDLCFIANGRIDSLISSGTEIHDFAAGKLIAKEAGAKIIDFKGKKETDDLNRYFVISNSEKINKYIFNMIKPLQKKL